MLVQIRDEPDYAKTMNMWWLPSMGITVLPCTDNEYCFYRCEKVKLSNFDFAMDQLMMHKYMKLQYTFAFVRALYNIHGKKLVWQWLSTDKKLSGTTKTDAENLLRLQLQDLHDNSIYHGNITSENIEIYNDRYYLTRFSFPGYTNKRMEDDKEDLELALKKI